MFIYSLNQSGQICDEQWVTSPWCAPIHDCAITPNFIILILWPYEVDLDGMKKGGQHWIWTEEHPATFVVVPRPKNKVPPGWQYGEYRTFQWHRLAFLVHSASAWEVPSCKIFIETSRVYSNLFPMFGGSTPNAAPTSDFVRWEIDPSKPSYSVLPDPEVILDLPSELPRTDERQLGRPYNILFLPVCLSETEANCMPMPLALNGLTKLK